MKNNDCIIINYTGRKGGGALDAYEQAKAFLNIGLNVVPIISSAVENKELWEKAGFQKIIFIDTYNDVRSLLINTLTFRHQYKNHITESLKGYNIKMIYCPMITFWTEMINKIIGKHFVVMVNHDPIPHSGQSIFEPARLFNPFKRADVVVVHSKFFLDYAAKKYKRAVYIPLGRHNMYSTIENKKKIVCYDENKVNFLFFGRIEKYKGLDILAKAYKTLSSKYADKITLTIIGNGYFAPYEELYSELDNVKIINRWINDNEVESIFLGKNLINVCPYKDATQSGVVLVSYDYGVPVIATNTGGLSEQVLDGKTGFLVKPCDAGGLYLAMEKYLLNNSLIEQQQKNIQEYLENISWSNSAKKLIRLMRKR